MRPESAQVADADPHRAAAQFHRLDARRLQEVLSPQTVPGPHGQFHGRQVGHRQHPVQALQGAGGDRFAAIDNGRQRRCNMPADIPVRRVPIR